MADLARPRGRVVRAGRVAARFLADGGAGAVAAVFARSLYLASGDRFVCLGAAAIGDGPLNATVTIRDDERGFAGLAIGQRFDMREGEVRIGPALTLAAARFDIWRPPAPSPRRQRSDVSGFAGRMCHGLAGRLPEEGLARAILLPGERIDSAVARAARAPLAAFGRAIEAALGGTPGEVAAAAAGCAGLLGLGPGLTPSGDDVVGGAMIALRAAGCDAAVDRLWRELAPLADGRISPLSRAHLAAAAEGEGAAGVHEAINALLATDADALRAAVPRLAAIGHCSGFDAFAGAMLALRVWSSRCEALANPSRVALAAPL